MATLHYAEKELKGDIKKIHFSEVKHLTQYVQKIYDDRNACEIPDRVYLFTYHSENDEVYVTSNLGTILDLLNDPLFWGFDFIDDFFLQEYNSFEEAYEVALTMKESSPLCYEPKSSLDVN